MPATRVRVGKKGTARFVAQPVRQPLSAQAASRVASEIAALSYGLRPLPPGVVPMKRKTLDAALAVFMRFGPFRSNDRGTSQ